MMLATVSASSGVNDQLLCAGLEVEVSRSTSVNRSVARFDHPHRVHRFGQVVGVGEQEALGGLLRPVRQVEVAGVAEQILEVGGWQTAGPGHHLDVIGQPVSFPQGEGAAFDVGRVQQHLHRLPRRELGAQPESAGLDRWLRPIPR
ncbi:MAG: hypothetical protein QM804_16385 [Propionicimonas sp.]